MINKVFLMGNLGREPEIKYLPDGTVVVNFSLATSEKRAGKEYTEWHRVAAFGKIAEVCSQHITKGTRVFVEGRIHYETWEKDGEKRSATKIIINQIKIISGGVWDKKEDGEDGGPGPTQFDKTRDEEIPF
jgi:single-strand DNA-binding protein